MSVGNKPIPKKYYELMNDLAKSLDQVFNNGNKGENKTGFILLAFPSDNPKLSNYISNCKREDAIAAMKEFIARAEGRYVEGDETKIC